MAPWNTSSASGFRNRAEGWIAGPQMHNRVHVWVGGSMLPLTSPNDPVFFLNHSFEDKLWADWQRQHPGEGYLPTTGAAPGHNLHDAMQPWEGLGELVRPSTVLDHHALGYAYDTEPECGGGKTFPKIEKIEIKEGKFEKQEFKEFKQEKLEKPERKELKQEKVESPNLKKLSRRSSRNSSTGKIRTCCGKRSHSARARSRILVWMLCNPSPVSRKVCSAWRTPSTSCITSSESSCGRTCPAVRSATNPTSEKVTLPPARPTRTRGQDRTPTTITDPDRRKDRRGVAGALR